MEHPPNQVEIIEEVHSVPFDPSPTRARDVSIQGRGRGTEIVAPISASLGAMTALVAKLEMLMLAPSQGCSSKKVKDAMRFLKDDVEKMSSYLDDLSEVEDPPPTANCWMNEARDLSYDMEDYIDNLVSVWPEDPSLVHNNIKTTRSRSKFISRLKLSGHAKTPKTQVVIAEMLSEFRMYVQEAIERHQRYNLHSCSTLRRRFVSLGPMFLPTPYEETNDTVIDGRMNEFINSLANDGNQQLKVLSIVGSACLGKTTLARLLYNKFGGRYNCRAFIGVSKKPDMRTIFCDMLSQLQRQHPTQNCKEIDLISNIKKYLQDKRYLIIIDDVWAASVWDIISHAFPNGSHGSRIITTTQNEDVALTCCCYQSEHVFEMKPLDDDHSRKLFFTKLFGSESYCPEKFKEVSDDIVKICGGLPLATISIASLLVSQPVVSIDLLTSIHCSLRSCLSANSTSERTREVLNVSFNNLPHYLKTCLLYFSLYPEGYKFLKDDLVKQWVAEGFINAREGQDMEEVAGSYFDELIGRRFIQPICINYNNEVLSYTVHDVVHDLIAHKSAENNFILAIDYSRKRVSLSHKVRRLSLLFGDARYAKTPANIRKSQVRSLTFFGLLVCVPCIREFKLLRVINLQLSGHGGDDDPVDLTGISEMFQLRYLKIACDACIKLPNDGLQCLETLDIMDARDAYAPWGIHLPHLLHLSLPAERNLLDWLVSMGNKLNYLQDIHLSIPSTPSHVVKRRMEDLGSLIGGHGNLKTIVVAHGSSVKNSMVRGASKVTISWDHVAPPPLLQRFECSPHSCIIFYSIPLWVSTLGNLCILKIAVRQLWSDCVYILRGLPALTALSLYVEIAPIDKIIFDKASGLALLKYFKLRCTSGIAWLKFEADAMPNLWKLKLVFDAIPRMDQHLFISSNQAPFEIYQHGTAVISIEHMPGLKEISTKFGGAAADVEYAWRIGVSNHHNNPTISVQFVNYSAYGDESTKQRQQRDEILEQIRDEYGKTLEIPADKWISRSPESSSRPHVQDIKAGAGAGTGSLLGSGREKEPSDPYLACLPVGRNPNYAVRLRSLPRWDQELDDQLVDMSLHDFTLEELMSATNYFSYFLGEFSTAEILDNYGFGYPGVYKGSFDGNLRPGLAPQQVAVTYLDQSYMNDGHEWLMRAVYLQKMSHPHLVKLVGFCSQNRQRLLVYEYMSRGSLKYHLLENLLESLPWLTRLKIAVGAAKGLAFLHEADTPIIYGDFKASNIQLDSDYTAKLSGFGLAKECPDLYTLLYLDVYNFGVVLLELLAGRPSVDKKRHGRQRNLVDWSRPYLLHEDKLQGIMDPSLKGRYSVHAAWRTVTTARWCLQSVPEERPRMHDVVEALEPLLALGDDDKSGAGGDHHGNLFGEIGRDLSISCLLRLSRSDYGSVACLNRDFNLLVRNGEIYRLRRQNGVAAEHWVYFLCNALEWDAYDPYRERWIKVPRMPPDEYFMCSDKESLAVGTELLVFAMSNTVYRYSILTNSWTRAYPMKSARCLFGSTSLGEKAYVAGGIDSFGRILSSAEMYDSETHTWTPLPSMNRARRMCSGVFMDGKFYVIGGETSNNVVLTCGEEYDLKRQSWRVIDNMSEGINNALWTVNESMSEGLNNEVGRGIENMSEGRSRVKISCQPLIAVVNNELYATDYSDMDVKKYDKLNNKWITLGKLPERLTSMNGGGFALRACGDRLIVIGGPRTYIGGLIEIYSWIPDEHPPVWNLVATRPVENFVYNCAVMGC